MLALDFATQLPEMKAIAASPTTPSAASSAITRDGTPVIASASGSQLASYAWARRTSVFVVGAQKLVPSLKAAQERIVDHSLPLEDARAYAAYGQNSRVGKILQIHQEDPAASTLSPSGSRSASRAETRCREARAHHGAARRGGRSRPRPIDRSPDRRVWRLANAPIRGRRFARSNGSNVNSTVAFASASGTSR